MTRAVFVDRDGTINRDIGFLRTPERLEVLPGVVEALRALVAGGYRIVVLTNQSGIARGLCSESDLAHLHEVLHARLERLPDAYLHCPHHPEQTQSPYGVECRCRKPKDGLLLQAVELLGVQLDGSFLVGDSARDVVAARGHPLHTVLVRSGKPVEGELAQLGAAGLKPDHVAADLRGAADWILEQGSKHRA